MDFSVQVVKEVLLNELRGEVLKNVVSSPLLIAAMLNILAMGSKGRTLEKLLSLFDSKTLADVKSYYSKLAAVAADGGSKGPLINFVNGAWVDKRYTLNPSFQQVLSSVFGVDIKSLDIANKPDETANEVNSWVKDATKGLITQITSEESILINMPKIIIANALYFKGSWETEFDPSMTIDRDFHLLKGEKVQAPFMSDAYSYRFYGSFNNFKVTKLPYRNRRNDPRRFSMHIFLPDERDGLHNLLMEFSANPFLFLNQNLAESKTELREFLIPKFKFSYQFEVSRLMMGLGLKLDEVTEMIENEMHNLNIIQKARIIVNEEGTEAAAVTEMWLGSCLNLTPPPPRPSFVADHPFMFMIREDNSATPFFVGLVFNPLLDD